MSITPGDDLRRDLSRKEIDDLIASPNWFPFVETWSVRTPSQLFERLVESAYGSGEPDRLPKIQVQFIRSEFPFAMPDRFRKPVPQLVGSEGKTYAILTHDIDMKDYREMNAVGEFYTEDLRLSSSKRRFQKLTPIEMWDRERDHIVKVARDRHGPNAGPYEIRNAVVAVTKESNPFRPTLALAVYSLLNARTILDMSAGWGDRLLGALAWARRSKSVVRYQGYDPFVELQARYSAMISDFAKDGISQFVVTPAPFESAPIEENTFDLAFTSPPYFDFEEYGFPSPTQGDTPSSRETQSTVRYPEVSDWVEGFLKPMMQRASHALRIRGYLAINIEGPFMYGVLDKSASDPALFGKGSGLQMEYQGIIGYRSDEPADRRVHPIFVWRRMA